MNKHLLAATCGILLALAPMAAQASTMPKADFGRQPIVGLGLGYGAGISLDVPVSSQLTLGGGLGVAHFLGTDANLRLMYKLAHADRLGIDLLAGAEFYAPFYSLSAYNIDPFIGVGLAYPLTSRLTLRGNIGVAVLHYGTLDADGIELGYKFSPTLEGTIGANGRGDIIGLKLAI